MPSRQSLPRIRIDLPDTFPYGLSPSSTFDIKDILGQMKLLPMLLAEDFVFDDAHDISCFEDSHLQDLPSFPMGRQPPLFILNSHHARLPFHMRSDAFELGDFCRDEPDVCPLLTAPTVPRMKLMMMERLYVQKWVDSLAPDNPPKHIPWTCEKPATRTDWIAEGSIFPADKLKPNKFTAMQRQTIQERSCISNPDRFSLVAYASHSRELCALSDSSSAISLPMEFYTSIPQVRPKSADTNHSIFRGASKTSHTPHGRVRTSQVSTSRPFGSQIEMTPGKPDAPLAARRGKSLGCLKLKGGVVEHLEYPDIPTAFRGSPTIWSPRAHALPVPYFTDHESMLLDLKSKCAVLGGGISANSQEPQTDPDRVSLSVDEWTFTQGLATFNNSFLGSINSRVAREIATDTSIFLPDDSSTPVKSPSFIARLRFSPLPHPTPSVLSSGNRSSDPPRMPLPPRPSLINPSTPPHVRGILKKSKSVRFENMTSKESEDRVSLIIPSPQASPERPSTSPVAVSSERPCTPSPITGKPSNGLAPVKQAPGKNIQKKPTPKSRLPPMRTKANTKHRPTHSVGNSPEPSKPISAATFTERPCRMSHPKENTNSTTVPRAQARKGLSITEVNVRRGIEGATKGRLSTPLRNIFRFR